MRPLLKNVAGAACTLLAVAGLVAAGAALFLTFVMPFVFPVFLVVAGIAAWRASARRGASAVAAARELPAANGERARSLVA